MLLPNERKKEGFQGQKAIVIPRKIIASQCAANPIIGTLYVTDIGYYPKAKFHYRERPNGADQHILVHCIEGCGNVTIGKSQLKIEAGEFFIVPIKMAHMYAADETNAWTIHWMHFKGTTSAAIVALMQQQINGYKGLVKYNENSTALFNEIYSQLERGYRSDNLLYANMCLWHYLSTFMYNNSKPNGADTLHHKDTIDRAIDFLTKKIGQVLTLEEMAKSVNLSPSHFSYVFKKKTGFTPIEYFNHLKVQKACQYLLFTDLRIKEIAFESGIEDPYYFSRMFTKIMGIAPNDYREKRIH